MAPQRENAPSEDFDQVPSRTHVGPDWAPAVERTASRRSRPARFEPRSPAEVVYLHAARGPSALGDALDQSTATQALRKARRPSRGMIPLLWTAAFAGAALMHAAEIDRRASLREPSPVELQMQERPTRQIKGAWRSIDDRSVAVSAVPNTEAKSTDAGNASHAAVDAAPEHREQPATEVATTTSRIAEQRSTAADRPSEASRAPVEEGTTRAAAVGVEAASPPAEKPRDLQSRIPESDSDPRSIAAQRPPANGSPPHRRKHALAARTVVATANLASQNEYGVVFFIHVARRTP